MTTTTKIKQIVRVKKDIQKEDMYFERYLPSLGESPLSLEKWTRKPQQRITDSLFQVLKKLVSNADQDIQQQEQANIVHRRTHCTEMQIYTESKHNSGSREAFEP